MCGIVGVAGPSAASSVTRAQISHMCAQIKYRGPDDEGIELVNNVGLGMRRLSIIDLQGSKQPISNEDNTIRTIFNGEIYNFKQLRKTLTNRGHTFRTDGDTEVIVHAYEEYGAEFPKHLNGMFSIAVHDSNKRRLFLARDHIGIKPLFYAFADGHFVWGSEIKTLLASGIVDPELDVTALNEFLTWEYIPGEATLLQGVRKLLPGHALTVDLQDLSATLTQYWDIPDSHRAAQAESEWIDEVDEAIERSVRTQMVSDVPIGAFLSGGVDSSLVAAAMGNAKTFSIGFDDPSYNELPYSNDVANHLGVDHNTEIIKADVADLFETLMDHLDDPIGDFSIFPTYLVSRLARNQVTVALSGDGADEIFGGYETYVANHYAQGYNMVPAMIRRNAIRPIVQRLRPRSEKKGLVNKLKRFVEGASQPPALGHCRWRMFMDDTMRDRIFVRDVTKQIRTPATKHIVDLFAKAGDRSDLNKALYVDVRSYLCDNILTKVDRMSMAVSLETRVPLLDRDLVELAFAIPARLKVANGATKVLLKQVAERHVPSRCVYRQKEGFSIPMKTWLGTQFRPILEDMLGSRRIANEGLFDSTVVDSLRTQHLNGVANHSHLLWSLIVFEAWRERWLKPRQAFAKRGRADYKDEKCLP